MYIYLTLTVITMTNKSVMTFISVNKISACLPVIIFDNRCSIIRIITFQRCVFFKNNYS